jgi:hypothetical protein
VYLLQSKALKQIGIFNEALSFIPEDGTTPPLSASPEGLFADGE